MDGWSVAEARTWLAMDLLAPVHELWAALEAAPTAQVTAEGLLGEHRPVLTEAALAGGVDLERALVVGAALERVGGFADGDLVAAVECALVDEACRLSLMPLVNAAADLVLELEREAAQGAEAVGPADPVDPAGADDVGPVEAGPGAPRGTSCGAVLEGGPTSGARSSGDAHTVSLQRRPGVDAEAGAGGTADVLRRGSPGRGPGRGRDRGAARGRTSPPRTRKARTEAASRTGRGGRSRGPPLAARSLVVVGAGPAEIVPVMAVPAGGQGPRSQRRR